jgi:hypothetical protein
VGVARSPINDHEREIISQHGEDGILAHLVRALDPGAQPFLEIGFHPAEANLIHHALRNLGQGTLEVAPFVWTAWRLG